MQQAIKTNGERATGDGNVRVVERVVQLLEAVSGREGTSLKELSERCGLPVSTTSRLLDSMQRTGLVEREPMSKRYQLGRMLFRLVGNNEPRKDIIAAAHPILESLALATSEDALLAELQDGSAVFIDHVEGSHPLKIVGVIGRPEPLHHGAFRKVLLAYQDDQWIAEYLKGIAFRKLTKSTITSAAGVWKEVRKIRAQGYATSFGEWIAEAGGVAAPVFDYTGRIRAAVHIVGPISRLNSRTAVRYVPQVIRAAEQLSTALGGPRHISTR